IGMLTARGSATESAALLDVCLRLKLLDDTSHQSGKEMIVRIVSMLIRTVFDHRSNRLNTVFQGPDSLGRSRHGTPVRRHHTLAPMEKYSAGFGHGHGHGDSGTPPSSAHGPRGPISWPFLHSSRR